MRLIGPFPSEEQALGFFSFLSLQGMAIEYERKDIDHLLWVRKEEDFQPAKEYYEEWKKNPQDARFVIKNSQEGPLLTKKRMFFSCTQIVLMICALLYLACTWQEMRSGARDLGLIPLQQSLFFDDPKSMQDLQEFLQKYPISSISEQSAAVQRTFEELISAPLWKGASDLLADKIEDKQIENIPPLFEKIRQGELWRIFSPSFLHRDLLHILFNMSWLLILGREIEYRIKWAKMTVLILCLAAFSNTAQYLMSGPYFLGFSGVVAGLAGFIWSRQKKAPEERYPFHRTTILFLFYLVLVLSAIGVLCFFLQTLGGINFGFSIANTAHISGGLLGLILGRLRFFSIRCA
jgi:GlpG protein